MKQKEARDRLFRDSRPNIRPLDILTEDGTMGGDMGVLWGAYRKGTFSNLGKLSQEEFTEETIKYLSRFQFAWIVDDRNYHFPSGYGPVGIVVGRFNGWALEPHWIPFSWATARNRLRTAVAYFQMIRYEKDVGVLNVFSSDKDFRFFKRIGKKYGVIYYIGKFPRGDFGEDRYMFYGRGGSYFKGKRLWAA
jgi:hypothetical protein